MIKKIIVFSILLFLAGGVSTPVFAQDHENMKNEVKMPLGKEVPFREYGASITNLQNKGYLGQNIKIAVLDTGFDMESQEVNIVKGYNFVDDSANYQDDNGHGTKIAGIIGAKKNGKLLLGVAPKSELYIGKIADENGKISFKDLVKGINWAVQQKVNIINLSVEFYQDNPEMEQAIKKATNQHILVVASSGNSLPDKKIKTVYPAAYENVVSVGMLDSDGDIYSKDFEKKKTDVYAVGEDVTGLYLNNKMTFDTAASFATANATGTFALLLQKNKAEQKDLTKNGLIKEYNGIVKARSSWQDMAILFSIAAGIVIVLVGINVLIYRLIKIWHKRSNLFSQN